MSKINGRNSDNSVTCTDKNIWIGRKTKNGKLLPPIGYGWEGFGPKDIDAAMEMFQYDFPKTRFVKCKCIFIEQAE